MTQGQFDAKEETENMKEKILEKVDGSFCMLPSLILIFNLILKLKKKQNRSMCVHGSLCLARCHCHWAMSSPKNTKKKQKMGDTSLPCRNHVCVRDTSGTSTRHSIVKSALLSYHLVL